MRVALMAILAVFVAGGPPVVRGESQPSVTRGEAQLAFMRGGGAWVMGSDGRGQHRLPILSLPVQSPDGKWLAWWNRAIPSFSRLMVARSDWRGSREVARTRTSLCYDPKWSPDSRRISYVLGCD